MKTVSKCIALVVALLGASRVALRADEPVKASGAVTREFDAQGFHVRIDASGQVIGVDVPEDRGFSRSDRGGREEAPVSATLQVTGGFVSASVLAQKAKQFDDGLYAAVELAAQNGCGKYMGKARMLARLASTLANGALERSGNVETVLLSACRLGDATAAVPSGLDGTIDSAISEFNSDALRSKPIGFYTWSRSLSAIFKQDRMLQSELKGEAGIAALARAIQSDPSLRSTYEGSLALAARLTNPLVGRDLRGAIGTVDAGGTEFPAKGLVFFPPSRAHEADLVMKLYGGMPIPDGFNLVEEMARRVRSGEIDLRPTASSGWYDYQTWALEPLVAPERAAEAARLRLEPSYRKQLKELFIGILALTRETHVKQLEIPTPGARAGAGTHEPVKIRINPDLSAEPLVTFYARRAKSYQFVRSVLAETFGADAIGKIHRQTAGGPVEFDLATELLQMESLFAAAAETVGRELGLASAAVEPDALRRWAQTMRTDPDLGRDSRMMVPVFFDLGRRKTKVWVFLGWTQRPVHFWFATPPKAEVTKNGQPTKADEVQVEFGNAYLSLAYPVTAEIYVDSILDRDEFRRHCDRYKTRSEILKNLK